jgi:hypothetical protein
MDEPPLVLLERLSFGLFAAEEVHWMVRCDVDALKVGA